MRNSNLIYFAFTNLVLFVTSCSYLDIQPTDIKSGENVWTDRIQSEAFLHNIYSYFPDYKMNEGNGFMGLSDEIDYTWEVYPTASINRGNWNSSTNFLNYWNSYYQAIRNTFVFENNIDRNDKISQELILQYKAEVKFLRGYFYSLLLKQYGPVPLIKEEIPASADWNLPRAPYDEIVSYIIDLMDEAAKDLPDRWVNTDSKWVGKPDQLICKAIKADLLLHAASPQWNGNKLYENFINKEGVKLANTEYDASRWNEARDAIKEAIDFADQVGVRLYKNAEGANFNPYKSVRDVYFSWNSEIIWGASRSRDIASGFTNNLAVHASPGPNNLGGASPTQRIVDAFFMNNGKWISDETSGYEEEGFAIKGSEYFKPEGLDEIINRVEIINALKSGDAWGHWPGDWKMYANREPRFYASILYNRRIIPQLPTDKDDRDYYSSPNQADGYGRVELYYGGTSRQSGSYTFYPKTGYLQLKMINPHDNMRRRYYADQNRPRVIIRYGKLLLDYVEVMNEIDPNDPLIERYWNEIRERAGIPGIYDVYPNIKGDRDKQREHIIRERQLELCFEESFDRYFTMRRRLLAGTPDDGDLMRQYGAGGDVYGMDVNAGDPNINNFLSTKFYKRTVIGERSWDDKQYLFPIPRTETERNKGMVQNPGW